LERNDLKTSVARYGKRWEKISEEVFHGILSPGQLASQFNSLKGSM